VVQVDLGVRDQADQEDQADLVHHLERSLEGHFEQEQRPLEPLEEQQEYHNHHLAAYLFPNRARLVLFVSQAQVALAAGQVDLVPGSSGGPGGPGGP